jgi:hypothetical protein
LEVEVTVPLNSVKTLDVASISNIWNDMIHFNEYMAYQISNLKTSFRRIQRQNILIIEKKELDKFENLAKENKLYMVFWWKNLDLGSNLYKLIKLINNKNNPNRVQE